MESSIPEQLAEAFPNHFRSHGFWLDYIMSSAVVRVCDTEWTPFRNEALLAAALRDLCDRANLRLREGLTGEYSVWKHTQHYGWMTKLVHFESTLPEAVLAAADEINKRLEANSDGS